jgi:hypothetical protein
VKYSIRHGNAAAAVVSEVGSEIARQTEQTLMHQLNEFISCGLIEIESSQPLFVREQDSDNVTIRTAVKLKLKDQDYIESLERQIKELNDLVSKLREKGAQS